MTSLCSLFPGADIPINYGDCEVDVSEGSEDEYASYSHDSLRDTDSLPDTDSLLQLQVPTQYPDPARNKDTDTLPRPSFVDTQVSRLQTKMAAEAQPRTAIHRDEADTGSRIGPIRIPKQFADITEARSPVAIERTSSSPAPSVHTPSDISTLQDSLQVASPHVFSESSSPRRLSPIHNYNVGNMNPRHIDIDRYSPSRSPSVTSTLNSRKEDFNQNYCDRLSAANRPMSPSGELNGNLSQRPVDGSFQTPLEIEVDPVS